MTTSNQILPSPALSSIASLPRLALRRPTKQLSWELANHAKAYIEGDQFASGYDFLTHLLAAGTAISTPAQPHTAFLAPAAYLALAASLLIWPPITTQTLSADKQRGADAALRYLRAVVCTVDDAAYAVLRCAFAFPKEQARRRGAGRNMPRSPSPGVGGDVDRISGRSAGAESVWECAEDFWHVVGWAFNCAVAQKRRWERWRLWLEVVLDVVEGEWEVCEMAGRDGEGEGVTGKEAVLRKSLLWHYVVGKAGDLHRGVRRRMVRAVFASATPESLKEFPEVWERETWYAIKVKKEAKTRNVDFAAGETGDYDGDEEILDVDGDGEVGNEDEEGNDAGGELSVQDVVRDLGGADALQLRQRLVALLTQVAAALPAHFTTLSDFFDNILEDFIRRPPPIFHVLLSTLTLPPSLLLAFNANLLLPLVSGKLPDYFRSTPTQAQFEGNLLLLRASTQSFAANAKVSLVLEQLLLSMCKAELLSPTKALRQALDRGIQTRHGVCGTGGGVRGNAREEEQAKVMMEACSERMVALIEVLEMKVEVSGKGRSDVEKVAMSFGMESSLSSLPDSTDVEE